MIMLIRSGVTVHELSGSLEGGDFRIPNCHEIALELVWGADFWCNRHYKTSPVVLEGMWGQVWPTIGRKPEKSEYRVANEPLSDGLVFAAGTSKMLSEYAMSFWAWRRPQVPELPGPEIREHPAAR